MSDNQKILRELTVECARALFEHYGVALDHHDGATPTEVWSEDLALAGIIGLTSDELRGCLVLAMGRAPLDAVESDASTHRDWIQELSNQLLGRMKNRLLAYGVNIQMTTPMSMRGMHLTLEASAEDARPLLFKTPEGGAVCVLLDTETRPGFELTKNDSEENSCPDEGELLLF